MQREKSYIIITMIKILLSRNSYIFRQFDFLFKVMDDTLLRDYRRTLIKFLNDRNRR